MSEEEDKTLSRYIKPHYINEEGEVDGAAFRLRPGETGLSMNMLDHHAEKTHMASLFSLINSNYCFKLKPAKKSVFTVHSKIEIERTVKAQSGIKLTLLPSSSEPSKNNKKKSCHRELSGYASNNELVADIISETIKETVRTIDMPNFENKEE